jgi:hypothetical protein
MPKKLTKKEKKYRLAYYLDEIDAARVLRKNRNAKVKKFNKELKKKIFIDEEVEKPMKVSNSIYSTYIRKYQGFIDELKE